MRTVLYSLIASCGLLVAAPASAVSLWYADVFTSNLLGNVHGEITLPTSPSSISDLLAGVDLDVVGSGLGSGLVTTSTPITLTHIFAPDMAVASITSASLIVSVIDDFDILTSEEVAISVGGIQIDGGSGFVLAGLFGGNVTAHIASIGDSIGVEIEAVRGDFKVGFSALSVKFDSTSQRPAIPEPTAALVFAAGLVIASRRRS